jgi:CubicO group peptidase (beta-lactamase class C family)
VVRRNFRGPCRWLVLLAVLVLSACSGADEEIPATGAEVAAFHGLDDEVRAIMRKLGIPGASVTVAQDGRIVYQRGFGWSDRGAGAVVQPDTVFRIASVSKSMTALAVLRAFEAELPAALDRHVFGPGGLLTGPRYTQIKDPRVLKVTLRDLLQHTSGWDSGVYEPQYDLVAIAGVMKVPAPAGAQDITEYMLRDRELQFEPGTRFSYSNFGYNVLGRVLEQKTGLPYDQAMQQLVFKPAGVTCAVIGGDTLAQRLPGETIYYDDPRWQDVPSQTGTGSGRPAYAGFHLQAMDAHGGWVMSSADMVRVADAVDGHSGGIALLSRATVQRLFTKDPNVPNTDFGLGWERKPSGWGHNGALTVGTLSQMERLDNGLTWAVVYNSLPSDPDRGLDGLREAIVIAIDGLRAAVIASVPTPR